jgi:hypothetical protein
MSAASHSAEVGGIGIFAGTASTGGTENKQEYRQWIYLREAILRLCIPPWVRIRDALADGRRVVQSNMS